MSEALDRYDLPLDFKGESYFKVRDKILKELPEEFDRENLRRHFQESESKPVQRALSDLQKEGQLQTSGRGKGRRWIKIRSKVN